jgi:hypothetical protein
MTLEEHYADVLAHLRAGRRAMRRLMAFSEDGVGKGRVEVEFDVLGGLIREFARYQLCLTSRPADAESGD